MNLYSIGLCEIQKIYFYMGVFCEITDKKNNLIIIYQTINLLRITLINFINDILIIDKYIFFLLVWHILVLYYYLDHVTDRNIPRL